VTSQITSKIEQLKTTIGACITISTEKAGNSKTTKK
jgi:hypothetical protein